jgi:hypothetical protein
LLADSLQSHQSGDVLSSTNVRAKVSDGDGVDNTSTRVKDSLAIYVDEKLMNIEDLRSSGTNSLDSLSSVRDAGFTKYENKMSPRTIELLKQSLSRFTKDKTNNLNHYEEEEDGYNFDFEEDFFDPNDENNSPDALWSRMNTRLNFLQSFQELG